MTTETEINLDTSVLFNYLYSTVLPDYTEGDAEFERNRGCREYFETPSVYLVAGGKACGELTSGSERRRLLYEDMADFMLETGEEIFEYPPHERDVHLSPNDPGHIRKSVKYNLANQPPEGQLSTIRRCHQQLRACVKFVLETAVDDTFEQFEDSDLRDEIDDELDINHDCDILVDAVYICRDHGIDILAALDSDITVQKHQEKLAEVVERELSEPVRLTIIEPENHELD